VRAFLLAALLGAASPGLAVSHAQEGRTSEGTVTLEVRVGSADRGWALIDRGSVDGVAIGDVVLFTPREGGTFQGRVVELEERAARVELQDRAFVPAPGTKGKVSIPRARVGQRARPRVRPAPDRPRDPERPPPVFENRDDGWSDDEPLLAGLRPLRPDERRRSVHGRSYAVLDYTRATEEDRSDGFARLGTSLVVENPFGRGDRLYMDGEWNYRKVDVPDLDDEEDVELRIDRLSWARGGNRFEPTRLEVGRFLQDGMVEFGVLDGAEWSVRGDDGHRFGASIGFMPEPDSEFQTGSDFQVAAHYRWVADESERTSAGIGYQKSWHNGNADRDLIVATLRNLPPDGWTFFGTAWIDVYTDGDDEKGTLFGLTQAYLSTGRRWASGASVDVVLTHYEFPELDRNEFLPVEDAQLADDHNERLGLSTALPLSRDVVMRTGVGAWIDEDDEGGDFETGFELRDVLAEGIFVDMSGFAGAGEFQKTLGARLSTGRFTGDGRWAVDYEFTQNRLDGFSPANDDLPQHRVRFSRDHAWKRWNLSWRVEALLYDEENAITVGLYLQRSHY